MTDSIINNLRHFYHLIQWNRKEQQRNFLFWRIFSYAVYTVHQTQLVTANKNEYFSAHFAYFWLFEFRNRAKKSIWRRFNIAVDYLLSDSTWNLWSDHAIVFSMAYGSWHQSTQWVSDKFWRRKTNYLKFRMLLFLPFLSVNNNNNSIHVCYLLLKQVIVKDNITLPVTYESWHGKFAIVLFE